MKSQLLGETPKIETIHAKRPVDTSNWYDELQKQSWESYGSLFNFYSPDEIALTILGSGEMYKMQRQSQCLGDISIKTAIRRAKKEVPDTFKTSKNLETGELHIYKYTEPQGRVRVLTLDVTKTDCNVNDRRGVTDGIDLTAKRWHDWDDITFKIKLAEVTCNENVGIEDLSELSSLIPDNIEAKKGFIRSKLIDPFIED